MSEPGSGSQADGGVPDVVILDRPVQQSVLRTLVDRFFGDMVKFVVDLEQHVVALGGDLHADAEQVLLEAGSRQADLWGGNYYPGRGENDSVEYTSLINIRPAQGNRAMELADPALREAMRDLIFRFVGRGEPLA